MDVDALIFGGGVAGLFILHALKQRGYSTMLVEADELGAGQTIAAQGILHGGGKYALRGVRDWAAVGAIREMPARWRACMKGERSPDLSSVKVQSEECLIWDSRGRGALARMSRVLLPMVARSGLLHTRPTRLPLAEWPRLLQGVAGSVYSMREPVIATGQLLSALLETARERVLAVRRADSSIERDASSAARAVRLASADGREELNLRARVVILAAGAGNQALLADAGLEPQLMQRRPLLMLLLRGRLESLYGHWIERGKTRLTVTTAMGREPSEQVWVLGGKIAEDLALAIPMPPTGRATAIDPQSREFQQVSARARAELQCAFPDLARDGLELAAYRVDRAEAARPDQRRPSGVDLQMCGERMFAAWPTKLALAPALADAALLSVQEMLGDADAERARNEDAALFDSTSKWPRPRVAAYPWQEAGWSAAF